MMWCFSASILGSGGTCACRAPEWTPPCCFLSGAARSLGTAFSHLCPLWISSWGSCNLYHLSFADLDTSQAESPVPDNPSPLHPPPQTFSTEAKLGLQTVTREDGETIDEVEENIVYLWLRCHCFSKSHKTLALWGETFFFLLYSMSGGLCPNCFKRHIYYFMPVHFVGMNPIIKLLKAALFVSSLTYHI